MLMVAIMNLTMVMTSDGGDVHDHNNIAVVLGRIYDSTVCEPC